MAKPQNISAGEYMPTRALRSSEQSLLKEKKSRLKSYGDSAFSVAVPRLWSSLPANLRDCKSVERFKHTLKTFLFKEVYDV